MFPIDLDLAGKKSFDFSHAVSPTYLFLVPFAPIFLLVLYRILLPKPLPGIPYNAKSAKSIWGDEVELRDDPAGLAKWCSNQLEKHGSPICQALMGPLNNPVVLVADTPETREMLMGRSDFDRSAYIIDRFPLFGGHHLNMKTGDGWRNSRGWLKDLLSPQYLHNVGGTAIHSHVEKIIELWGSKASFTNGKPFSIVSDLRTLALDVIATFHFGKDFPDSALSRQLQHQKKIVGTKLDVNRDGDVKFSSAPLHKFQQGLTDLGDRMASIYTTIWPPSVVAWWTRYASPYYRSLFENKNEFIRQYIDKGIQRYKNDLEAENGIDHMVYREFKLSRKFSRRTMFGDQIMIDEAYGNLLAGQHTTSAALVWIIKLLNDNQSVQARLYHELQAALSSAVEEARLPTATEIIESKIPFLDAFLEEVLRLRAAMLVPRDATRDTELLGRRIPKDTVVLLVCQGPDFSSKPTTRYWSDSKASKTHHGNESSNLDVFDPERWLVKNHKGEIEFDRSTYPQLAFGLGIRSCWGRSVAQLEMRIFTAMIVWKYELLQVPVGLASHDATYDISYRAKKGAVNLRTR